VKIEIEVSEKNESTASPYWMIIDPRLTESSIFAELAPDEKVNYISNMIDGPFFSREQAESVLNAERYNYGEHAVVWCCCAKRGSQYRQQVRF